VECGGVVSGWSVGVRVVSWWQLVGSSSLIISSGEGGGEVQVFS